MKFILESMAFRNFKGLRSYKLSFGDITNVRGQNGTGKTTLEDGFRWLLFGKDSTGRTNFEIKTLDKDNEPIHHSEHEVSAVLRKDSQKITVRRVYKEKWPTKKGEATQTFTGHEQEFFWDDVPLKEKEFQAKVGALIDEGLFRLLTNTSYFNSKSLTDDDRRKMLLGIAGDITNDDILSGIMTPDNQGDFDALISALNQGKTTEEYKKEISNKKKKIRDEKDLIPARISECDRTIEGITESDTTLLNARITNMNNDIINLDQQINDKGEAEKIRQQGISEKVADVFKMKNRCTEIEFEEKNKVRDSANARTMAMQTKRNELRIKQDHKSQLLTEYGREDKRLPGLRIIHKDMTDKWMAITNEQPNLDSINPVCPTCGEPIKEGKIIAQRETITKNFNIEKTRRLTDVTNRGTETGNDIKVIEANLANIMEQGKVVTGEIEKLMSDLLILEEENNRLLNDEAITVAKSIDSNTEYIGLKEMIRLREEEIGSPAPPIDNTDLIARKKTIAMTIDELKRDVNSQVIRGQVMARKSELSTMEETLAQELAELEGIEYSIERFNRAKMDTLEGRINGRFKIVKFKMFRDQINGGKEDACITLINGVPYADANTASKIQAGLDIINVFSEHYNIFAPVWIDNRESVIDLPHTDCQLINLYVSEGIPKLTVGTENRKTAVA